MIELLLDNWLMTITKVFLVIKSSLTGKKKKYGWFRELFLSAFFCRWNLEHLVESGSVWGQCSLYILSRRWDTQWSIWQEINLQPNTNVHSAKKGHVPNQSLYKGWEQSFSPFFPDQKMDIIFCQDGQFIKCRNKICFLLVTF